MRILNEKVSDDTFALWAQYEPFIDTLREYAAKNNEVLEIRIDGRDTSTGKQIWLNREMENTCEHIVLFTDGGLIDRVLQQTYTKVRG